MRSAERNEINQQEGGIMLNIHRSFAWKCEHDIERKRNCVAQRKSQSGCVPLKKMRIDDAFDSPTSPPASELNNDLVLD